MHTSSSLKLLAIAGTLAWLSAVAGEVSNGALLSFKVSSSAVPEASSTNRASVEGAILVAFNEKFTMQASPFRVELTAAEEPSSASVKVTLFDARTEPALLVGTQQVSVPTAGGNVIKMMGADGTAYAVSLQFKPAKLPQSKS